MSTDETEKPNDAGTYVRHFGRKIDAKSVKVIDAFHETPKIRKNIGIEQLQLPKLGSLSLLKPMIDENTAPVKSQASENTLKDCDSSLNDFQQELLGVLSSYRDLLYPNQTVNNLEDIQRVYAIHAINHLNSSRALILKNNKVFEKKTLSDNVILDDPALRDQGYTRAKILFLLPFRYSALRLSKNIIAALGDGFTAHNHDRFIQEFGDEDGVDSSLRPVASDGNKPSDYYQTFHGNTDDAFRVGLKLTKKSVKFFTDFYDSDIIIASPLGLKTIISPEEQQILTSCNDEQLPETGDNDFLSSIEIVVLDQADIFLMQNWEHVLDIMQYINCMPKKPRKMDIGRVRSWYLENWSKYYRQLIMFSSVSIPLIHSFFQTHSLNYEGYLTLKQRVDIPQVKLISSKCRQQFLYYDSPSPKEACDDRYNFFIKQVLPKYKGSELHNRSPLDHTLILVSSYFDYVRLRNHFRREKLSFTQICEYTEENKVSKARQLFYFGARQFLIYTERCHFYHRYKIKGIRNIIFYEPPVYAKFYSELVNNLTPELQGKKFDAEREKFQATTLFSNHDTLQLGAIMGYSNATKLIQNKKSIT